MTVLKHPKVKIILRLAVKFYFDYHRFIMFVFTKRLKDHKIRELKIIMIGINVEIKITSKE